MAGPDSCTRRRHQRLTQACKVVLENAQRSAHAIASAGPVPAAAADCLLVADRPDGPVEAADQGPVAAMAPACSSRAVTLLHVAVAAVLVNAQCHAAALGRAGVAEPAAEASTPPAVLAPTQLPPLFTAAWGYTKMNWRREHNEVLVSYLQAASTDRCLDPTHVVGIMGLAHMPDPNRRIYMMVKTKLHRLRNIMAHGMDPLLEGGGRPQVRNQNMRAFMRRAFQALPDCSGTLTEVAAVMEADPHISARLDRRPDPHTRSAPMWRTNMPRRMRGLPEFVSTGQKRGRGLVYRYDEEVARLQEERRAKAARKGVRKLPHLGRES